MDLGLGNTLLPGDPRLIDHIVGEVKSQGIFDQFRKDALADVDTKPAYQNLRTRVEGSVNAFLAKQSWKADMNKNQLRETLRKHISDAPYLDAGVERIVDQVVNPKIYSVFMPQIEDVVYKFLGIERPKREKEGDPELKDLLPVDLDPVSPESDKNSLKDVSLDSVDANLAAKVSKAKRQKVDSKKDEKNTDAKSGEAEKESALVSEKQNDTVEVSTKSEEEKLNPPSPFCLESNSEEKREVPKDAEDDEELEDEEEEEASPVFEPIELINMNESNDSHLSGISGLTSHRSRSPDFNQEYSRDHFDFSNQDSQFSKVSSDSRLSIVTDFGSSNQASTPTDVVKEEKDKKDGFKGNESEDTIADSLKKDDLEVKEEPKSKESSRDASESGLKEKSEKDKHKKSERSSSKDSRNHRDSKRHDSRKKEKSESSKDSEKSKDSKETKPKEEKIKDLKDIYKEKIRELREKKELTEKEKEKEKEKESKETKDKKDSKDKKDHRSSSSSSRSHSSSSHHDRKRSSSKDDSKSSRDKSRSDSRSHSKDSKSRSDDSKRRSDKSERSSKSSTRKSSKSESRSSDKHESEKDKKRRDEKKSKSKDDHSSQRKNSNDRRSSDRDGSNGRSNDKSNSSPGSSSKTNSSLNKESGSTSNSGETSDSVEESQMEQNSKEKTSTSEETILDSSKVKKVDLGSNEISLPFKKRSMDESELNVPDEERCQIIEVKMDDDEQSNDSQEVLFDPDVLSSKTKLSEMELSIKESLNEMMMMAKQEFIPNSSPDPVSKKRKAESGDEDCQYFKPNLEAIERYKRFKEYLKSIDVDSDVNNEDDDVSSEFKSMAPPQLKRNSASPLSDISVSSNNNNESHKLEEETNKKRKIGRRGKKTVLGSQSITNDEHFVMPLSPESDVSGSSEKIHPVKEEKVKQKSSQRYDSDDLYKPRSMFVSSRRNRKINS